jgi:hypothetical protein
VQRSWKSLWQFAVGNLQLAICRHMIQGISFLFALTVATSSLLAQLPQTQLMSVFPPGGRAGTELDVRIDGPDSDGASLLAFSHPGITATQIVEPAGEFRPKSIPRAGLFHVRISADVPPGQYQAWAMGRFGLSNPRTFCVSDNVEQNFNASDNSPEKPFPVAVGMTVNAAARPDARDYYSWTARAGETVLIQCLAETIDSRMDATIAVYRSDGRRLARATDTQTLDPALRFVAPQDGTYLVEVYDFVYRGGNDYYYRLSVDADPHLEGIFPPVGQPGTTATYTIYGYNLPRSRPVGVIEGTDGLEQATVSVSLPSLPAADAAGTTHELAPLLRPASTVVDAMAYRVPGPSGPSNPVLIGYAQGTVIMEGDGNDTPERAERVTTPCEYVGQFYPRNDQDWITFSAKRGEALWIDVLSNRLGLNTDPVLKIRKVTVDDKGNRRVADLTALDDEDGNSRSRRFRMYNTGSNDPSYRLRAQCFPNRRNTKTTRSSAFAA